MSTMRCSRRQWWAALMIDGAKSRWLSSSCANETATANVLLEHCRAQLARFKVPKEITFLDALPRNPSGKVLKRELRGGE
jgi:acyl-CoA synthetase (AMP-forming)/AMP-acid ligase II